MNLSGLRILWLELGEEVRIMGAEAGDGGWAGPWEATLLSV